MDYSTAEFWVQFGALGVLAGLCAFAFWKERGRANRAEQRLLATTTTMQRKVFELAEGFRKTIDALERRFPEE